MNKFKDHNNFTKFNFSASLPNLSETYFFRLKMKLLAVIVLIFVTNVFALSPPSFEVARAECFAACASDCPDNVQPLMIKTCGSVCMEGKFKISNFYLLIYQFIDGLDVGRTAECDKCALKTVGSACVSCVSPCFAIRGY